MPALGTIPTTDIVTAGTGTSCKVTRSTDQLVGTDINLLTTPVLWTTDVWKDIVGMHSTSTNTDRVISSAIGRFNLKGSIMWVGNATGQRQVRVEHVKPTPVQTLLPVVKVQTPDVGVFNFAMDFDVDVNVVAVNEYFVCRVGHNAGPNLGVMANDSWFQVTRLT